MSMVSMPVLMQKDAIIRQLLCQDPLKVCCAPDVVAFSPVASADAGVDSVHFCAIWPEPTDTAVGLLLIARRSLPDGVLSACGWWGRTDSVMRPWESVSICSFAYGNCDSARFLTESIFAALSVSPPPRPGAAEATTPASRGRRPAGGIRLLIAGSGAGRGPGCERYGRCSWLDRLERALTGTRAIS